MRTPSSLCFPSLGVLAETLDCAVPCWEGAAAGRVPGHGRGSPAGGDRPSATARGHSPGPSPGNAAAPGGARSSGLGRAGPGRARAAAQGPHRPTAVPALVWRRQEPLPEGSLQQCALTARSPLRRPPQPPAPEGAMVPTRWLCGVKHELLFLPMYPNCLVTTIF